MADLTYLRTNIKRLFSNRDAFFFHGIVQSLAETLDFRFKGEWFEGDPYGDDARVVFPTRLDLAIVDSMSYFKYFSLRKKHVKDGDYIISTTNHPAIEMLDSGIYEARSVMSNSLLGLKKEVIPYEQVRTRFPAREGRDSLALAFEDQKIVSTGINYFFHTIHLYELAEKKLLKPQNP